MIIMTIMIYVVYNNAAAVWNRELTVRRGGEERNANERERKREGREEDKDHRREVG